MPFLDVEAVHLNLLFCTVKCGARLVVDLETSKLVLIFLWRTAMNAWAQPFSVYFWCCNLELQVCSKSIIFNKR